MSAAVLGAAALASAAVWLAGPAASGRRTGAARWPGRPPGSAPVGGSLAPRAPATGAGGRVARGSPHAGAPDDAEALARWARPASLLAGAAAWLLLGGLVGLVVGIGLAVGLPVLLGRLESGSARRRRLALVQVAPVVADLLAAAMTAGVPLERALPVVARAVGGPAEGLLTGVRRRMELGEAAEVAWSGITQAPGLGDLARTVARSSRTGAPLAGLLATSAEELRAQAAADALIEVRRTGVRSVLPLGLCLLPAFVLLGIVPVVGGLLPSL